MRDKVYNKPQTHIVDFAFTEEVAAVFPDMIRRSVPGYDTVIPMTGLLAARHMGSDGCAFDLGCSLGATAQAILAQNTSPAIRVVGIDNAPAMIDGANSANSDQRVNFRLGDLEQQTIAQLGIKNANVIILNFVLQFFEPFIRLDVVRQLHDALVPGGLLIVSEKVRHPEQQQQTLFDETHLAWKRANGYSELEVSQKRSALENVMRVDTEEDHLARFKAARFDSVSQWYRCLNWASFLAYRQVGTASV